VVAVSFVYNYRYNNGGGWTEVVPVV
jgi:hypothetical protein